MWNKHILPQQTIDEIDSLTDAIKIERIAAMLKETEDSVNPEFLEVCREQQERIVRLLKEKKINIDEAYLIRSKIHTSITRRLDDKDMQMYIRNLKSAFINGVIQGKHFCKSGA